MNLSHYIRRADGPRVLAFALFILLLLPNIGLSLLDPMPIGAGVCNIILPGAVYMLLSVALRNPARSVWMCFPLLFLSAFQLVLLYLYGHSIISVDMFLNLVTTNTSEVAELLGSLLPAVVWVVILFVPVLYVAAVKARKRDFILSRDFIRRVRVTGIGGALAGVVCIGFCMLAGGYSIRDYLYPVNVCYNIYLAVDRSARTAEYAETSRDYTFDAVATHPADSAEVYVLVIGETARAGNFGLYGYSRNTTPRLSARQDIITYPRAYTQSNTTHKSVPMLLSAATADDYDRIYREKGLIAAFREAGFNTVFLSNQRPNHSFIDMLGEEAATCRFLKEEMSAGANPPDDDLIDETARLLDGDSLTGKTLIVLHTYGSHFRYNERYPRSSAHFLPDDEMEATPAHRASLVNAYDNTIVYTDSILDALITLLDGKRVNAAMLYTSDHGENIFDDEKGLFLHASPRPSAHELHVPLMIWLSEGYRANYPLTDSLLRANASQRVFTSASLFHTMLDLGGILTPVRTDTLSLASPNFRSGPYHYLTDRNIPQPVEKVMN
ncbi:MAG: lipid A phosphoethanolamine transferase [Duncaniella sp.]|nr:lipid A phosphoethanolamine transferase [Duncaniella sp.]